MEECAGASMESEHANTRAKYCAQYISYSHMSLVMRKPAFCICENNDAKLISAFVFATRIVQFFNFLNPKFQAIFCG